MQTNFVQIITVIGIGTKLKLKQLTVLIAQTYITRIFYNIQIELLIIVLKNLHLKSTGEIDVSYRRFYSIFN